MQYNTHILIVGAGPSGLTLACLLKKFGVPFIIIDKKLTTSDTIKACMLSSRSLEIFSDLGLLDRAMQLGKKIDGLAIYRDDKQVVSLEYVKISARFQFNLHLGQPYTETILHDHLQNQGVSVLWEHALLNFSQDENRVMATVLHHQSEIQITADYLVGADGSSSLIRKLCRIDFEGETYPNYFLLGNVKLKWDLPENYSRVFFRESGFLSVNPLPDGLMQIGGNLASFVDIEKKPSCDEFISLFENRSIYAGKIQAVSWVSYYRTHCRYVKRRIFNRVILLGDAAQIISPLTGLGMNAGIQDAENIAWKFKLIYQKIAKPALLSSYEAERYWLSRKLSSFSNVLEEIYSVSHDRGKSLREYMLSHTILHDSAQQKEAARLMQKDLNYRNCALFSGLSAGMQAPDPLLPRFQKTVYLFDWLDHAKHHLLVFSNEMPAWIAALLRDEKLLLWMEIVFITTEAVSLPVRMIHDETQDIYRAFRANSSALYLIRPDRYIGWST